MFIFSVILAQGPQGVPIRLPDLISISENIAGFLMVAGGILAAIVIVVSGIYYLMSGSDSAKVKAARDMLKAGVIGSLIIFGVGVIIQTVKTLAENPVGFF